MSSWRILVKALLPNRNVRDPWHPVPEPVYVLVHTDDGVTGHAARELWRSQHAFGFDALAEVEAAAAAASQAKLRLDSAVALARHSGASWADIGRAAGMARQSAQERWHGADGVPAGGGA